MTSLYNVQLAVTIGVVLLAYIIIVPLIGGFKAWVASVLGDDTPEEEGFLTLNPMAHISFFWITILVISQLLYSYMPFGFGQQIVINESNFGGKRGTFKFLCALFSNSFMAFIVAIGAFSGLLVLHGIKIALLLHQQPSIKNLYTLFPESSTFSLVVTFILLTGFVMASFTAALTFILNIFQILQPYLLEKSSDRGSGAEFLIFIIPILILYVCIDPLYKIVIRSVIELSYRMVYCFGLLFH